MAIFPFSLASLSLGPLAFSGGVVALLAAAAVAGAAARLSSRGERGIGPTLVDMLLVGMVAARLVFVAQWFDSFRLAPLSILDIRDGGFNHLAGALAAVLLAGWRGWRAQALRRPLTVGLIMGAVAGGVVALLLRMPPQPSLLEVPLVTLAGQPESLGRLAGAAPMVVNLWASWCPPCRREMPVLAAAQRKEAAVRFVFANQGESAGPVQRYLDTGALGLGNVVLDPSAALGQALGSKALPTTLFFDATGRLVETHVGALSQATLESKLTALRPAPNP